MHKKVKSLILAGVITSNSIGSCKIVFADNTIKTSKDRKIERITDDISNQQEYEWQKVRTISDLSGVWEFTKEIRENGNEVIILNKYIGSAKNTKVEIPRSIEGYKVELANLNSAMFPGVTHIRVAEAKDGEGQIKVLATNLSNGFANNDTLKYVNLEGLDVSDVTNMYGLFSFCKNLRVVEINDWVIRDTTDTTAMFYAKLAATYEEKKILVVTNSEKIDGYNFELSNRIPAIVTFNSNGGYFLGDTDILNMKVPRFTIHPGTLEELDKIIESDLRFADIPIREGYKFTGWYTEDPNPTNFYELLNMTYKARWEKSPEVEETETPENNGTVTPDTPPINDENTSEVNGPVDNATVVNDIEYVNGTGGPNTPCTLKVNTELGMNKLMNWLNDKSSNMSYYRLKEIIDNEDGTKTYQLHVFDRAGLVSYINIKVDGSNKGLTDKLNDIMVFLSISGTGQGTGTKENPHEMKVHTEAGLNELINWTFEEGYELYRTGEPREENGNKIYDVYAILENPVTYTNNNVIYMSIVVDSRNTDVINYLEDYITVKPEEEPPVEDNTPDTDKPEDVLPPTDNEGNSSNPNAPEEKPEGGVPKPPVEEEIPEEEVKPSLPSIFDKIDKNVVDVEKGEGTENNPLILTIKPVTTTKLNAFLSKLNDLNPKVTKVTRGNTHTEYKLEVDNVNTFLNRIFKVRLTNRTTYVIIKVENKQENLIKILNKFSKTTDANVQIPSIVKFTDVSDKHWARTNIEDFASMGLVGGYADGTFKPNKSITRAEFVKIINGVFGYTKAGKLNFTDVKQGAWYYDDIAIGINAGYVNGKSATEFKPNDKITRQEVAVILTNIMKNKDGKLDQLNKFPDGHKTSEWAKSSVEGAIEAGYLGGDSKGLLNPTKNITRAEAVSTLSRVKKLK